MNGVSIGMQINEQPIDPSLPGRLREFHQQVPLEGDPLNALLSLPDDQLLYLVTLLRNAPQPAPALSPEGWRQFLDLLQPHRVLPLLAFHLRSWPEECRPPQEVMSQLNRLLIFTVARTVHAGRQIGAVADAMRAAGIPAILLKGPALARTVYPDPALRQSVDIDLLVRPADVFAAEEVLEGIGYQCPVKLFCVSQHANNETFEAPDHGLPLELHWVLDYGAGLFSDRWFENLFESRITITSDDCSFDVMNSLNHLLYLAFHNVFQHAAIRLDWVYDTSLMMNQLQSPEEWKELIDTAFKHRIRIPMEHATTASTLWLGTQIPGIFRDHETWPAPDSHEQRLWRHATVASTSLYSRHYLKFQGQSGLPEKLRWICMFIFPPSSVMVEYRRSSSEFDLMLAHIRRWISIVKYR